jgi:hypothetical protein
MFVQWFLDCYVMTDGQTGIHGEAVLHISANFIMNVQGTWLERTDDTNKLRESRRDKSVRENLNVRTWIA